MKSGGQRTWPLFALLAACAVWAGHALAAAGAERSPGDAPPGLRIAISESIAGEVNGNDARAAIKAWAEAIARQTGIRIEPELCTIAQLMQRVRNRQVDAFAINILEYMRLAPYAGPELVVDQSQLPDGEEYLVLVHQSSGIQSLADLRGRGLLLHENTRMCLDRMWLDTLLASAHLGTAETALGRIESSLKLSRVVLPVFFRQADACLVSRRGFNTMCELNPQLAKQLRVLAMSPKLLTTFTAFHRDSPVETRRRFLAAVTHLHESLAGRQALMLFGGTRLLQADISALRTSLDVVHAYERIKGKAPLAAAE
jgi:phosphonate transport system substrate-binding protein